MTKNFQTFSSKSNVLKYLKKNIKYSKIEKLLALTVLEWEENSSQIIELIFKKFQPSTIIVRSSAIGEDSIENSEAGIYDSVQNINSHSKNDIKKAVNMVINSYKKKNNFDPHNQILIQTQTKNVKISGVVFTRTPNIGSPYYVINFLEGNSTDAVTKGEVSNAIKIFKKLPLNAIPKKWRKLIKSIREIEQIFSNDLLDIEFAITNNHVVIFQVRPITSIANNKIQQLDKKILKLISFNKSKFKKSKQSQNFGNDNIFSDMSDWNPSEIIGNNPNLLDYSIYDELIMKDTWNLGRRNIGYQNVRNFPLMIKFSNKPYVNLKGSFNSLIPDNVPESLKKKLIKFYFKKLRKHPYYHDKVEFEILFTCYDLTIDDRLNELLLFGFTKKDIKIIKKCLLEFTNSLIKQFSTIENNCTNNIETLTKNRNRIKQDLKLKAKTHKNLFKAAEQLLSDCKQFGTIPFSTMARISFVGSILLKSLKSAGYVTDQFINNLMNSVITPLSEIQNDIISLRNNELSKEKFLKKYGHLRPGTYDITALRYDNDNEFLNEINFVKKKKPSKLPHMNKKVLELFKKNGLEFENIEFVTFVKKALIGRELLKFEFTKNLSDALELIADGADKLGFTRDNISNIDYKTILQCINKLESESTKLLKRKIISQTNTKFLNNFLVLPPIIFSQKDFDIVSYYDSKPNFITQQHITGYSINLQSYYRILPKLDDKIILIENADPGYDWIFTKNPKGLITKYGGVASHVAIRCAEIGLPAAIGCGELLFEQLIASSKIMLDCKNEQVIGLEYENDELMEIKKTLKSLGYIR